MRLPTAGVCRSLAGGECDREEVRRSETEREHLGWVRPHLAQEPSVMAQTDGAGLSGDRPARRAHPTSGGLPPRPRQAEGVVPERLTQVSRLLMILYAKIPHDLIAIYGNYS